MAQVVSPCPGTGKSSRDLTAHVCLCHSWVGYEKEGFRGHQYLLEEGQYQDWRQWGGYSKELVSLRLIRTVRAGQVASLGQEPLWAGRGSSPWVPFPKRSPLCLRSSNLITCRGLGAPSGSQPSWAPRGQAGCWMCVW